MALMMVFRVASVVVLGLLLPIAAAGSPGTTTRGWLPKVLGWLLALIFLRPMVAAIYRIGFEFTAGGNDGDAAVVAALNGTGAQPARLRRRRAAHPGRRDDDPAGRDARPARAAAAVHLDVRRRPRGGGGAGLAAGLLGRRTAPSSPAACTPAAPLGDEPHRRQPRPAAADRRCDRGRPTAPQAPADRSATGPTAGAGGSAAASTRPPREAPEWPRAEPVPVPRAALLPGLVPAAAAGGPVGLAAAAGVMAVGAAAGQARQAVVISRAGPQGPGERPRERRAGAHLRRVARAPRLRRGRAGRPRHRRPDGRHWSSCC